MNPSQPVRTSTPGKALGIVGFILGFVGLSLIGLILSIVASVQSSKAGVKNGLAIAGIVTNSIFILIIGPLMLITIVSYNGITARANTNSAKAAATSVVKYAELYQAENGVYPTTFTQTMSTKSGVTQSKTFIDVKPSSSSTVSFSSCGDEGVKVGYWNYQTEEEEFIYAGQASAASSCTLSDE